MMKSVVSWRQPHPGSGYWKRSQPSLVHVVKDHKRSRIVALNQRDDLVEFLKEDLEHLFDDQGIDVTKYDDVVQFEDPITKHTTIQGYIKNIQFLKNVFNPIFILRDIKRTDEYEIMFRWTMHMTPILPFLGALTFTGTSRLGISPETGKFNRHIDTWDAVRQQKYFSMEAFIHMLGQLIAGQDHPQSYDVLLKRKDYEIREYRDENNKVACVFTNHDLATRDVDWIRHIVERDGLETYLVGPIMSPTVEVALDSFNLSEYIPLE